MLMNLTRGWETPTISFISQGKQSRVSGVREELLYGSFIINTSKRKILSSNLYSEVKFAQIKSTWNSMNKL